MYHVQISCGTVPNGVRFSSTRPARDSRLPVSNVTCGLVVICSQITTGCVVPRSMSSEARDGDLHIAGIVMLISWRVLWQCLVKGV